MKRKTKKYIATGIVALSSVLIIMAGIHYCLSPFLLAIGVYGVILSGFLLFNTVVK